MTIFELPDISEITGEIILRGITFKVRALSAVENTEFYNRSTVNGKFNMQKYNQLLLNNCIVDPRFSANDLSKFNTTEIYDVLVKKLPAGDLAKISAKIQEISGYNSLNEE